MTDEKQLRVTMAVDVIRLLPTRCADAVHLEKLRESAAGLVLFGLVGVGAFLPFLIMSEKAAQEDRRNQQFAFAVQPLAPIDTNRLDAVLEQAAAPIRVDLSTTNRLFNPVRWLKGLNGPIKVPPGGESRNCWRSPSSIRFTLSFPWIP